MNVVFIPLHICLHKVGENSITIADRNCPRQQFGLAIEVELAPVLYMYVRD